MKVINITHTDLDGVGCTIVLKRVFKNMEVESHFCSYHDVEQILSDILDNLSNDIANIFITDISFREESGLAERINKLNKEKGYHLVRLYDHHATSAYLNKYDWAWSYEKDPASGNLKCGTQWTYEILREEYQEDVQFNQSLGNFVELVNLWDTWRWVTDYPDGSPREEASWLNMLLSIEGKRKFINNYTLRIANGDDVFGPIENELIDCNLQEIKSDVSKKDKEMVVSSLHYHTKKSHIKFIKNYLKANNITDKNYLLNHKYSKSFKVGIIYLDRNVSIVCNKLAEMHPELDLIMSINLPKTVSLRCVKDLDVPMGILANFVTGKGGGHPKSAGGVLKPEFATMILGELLK